MLVEKMFIIIKLCKEKKVMCSEDVINKIADLDEENFSLFCKLIEKDAIDTKNILEIVNNIQEIKESYAFIEYYLDDEYSVVAFACKHFFSLVFNEKRKNAFEERCKLDKNSSLYEIIFSNYLDSDDSDKVKYFDYVFDTVDDRSLENLLDTNACDSYGNHNYHVLLDCLKKDKSLAYSDEFLKIAKLITNSHLSSKSAKDFIEILRSIKSPLNNMFVSDLIVGEFNNREKIESLKELIDNHIKFNEDDFRFFLNLHNIETIDEIKKKFITELFKDKVIFEEFECSECLYNVLYDYINNTTIDIEDFNEDKIKDAVALISDFTKKSKTDSSFRDFDNILESLLKNIITPYFLETDSKKEECYKEHISYLTANEIKTMIDCSTFYYSVLNPYLIKKYREISDDELGKLEKTILFDISDFDFNELFEQKWLEYVTDSLSLLRTIPNGYKILEIFENYIQNNILNFSKCDSFFKIIRSCIASNEYDKLLLYFTSACIHNNYKFNNGITRLLENPAIGNSIKIGTVGEFLTQLTKDYVPIKLVRNSEIYLGMVSENNKLDLQAKMPIYKSPKRLGEMK